jgi:hypothetical protein
MSFFSHLAPILLAIETPMSLVTTNFRVGIDPDAVALGGAIIQAAAADGGLFLQMQSIQPF